MAMDSITTVKQENCELIIQTHRGMANSTPQHIQGNSNNNRYIVVILAIVVFFYQKQMEVYAAPCLQLLLENLLKQLQPQAAYRQRARAESRCHVQRLPEGGEEQVVFKEASCHRARRTLEAREDDANPRTGGS